ncbi:hypothetical protein JMM81_08520 [Bacillus sp. V3B]|nr:hypothetical protein [Bacillus sp. V3B]MCQ6275003.1 hypothetical protein [Bacillus sp. V3B]
MNKDRSDSSQHKSNSQDELMNRVNQTFDQMVEDAKNLVNENKHESGRE